MAIYVSTDLDYLIPQLRLHLGDIDPEAYRYVDIWLRSSLVYGVRALERWWNFRYLMTHVETTISGDLVSGEYTVARNPHHFYEVPPPPVIQHIDERPIILMASILVKGGSLESSAWGTGSWKDAEISYSNIAGGKIRDESLARDLRELELYLKPPNKRLAQPRKGSLPGFKRNRYENGDVR